MRALIAVALAAVLVAGCGSGQTDEQQVKDTVLELAEHGREHRWGDFCALTTNPDGCAEALVMLEAAGVDAGEFIPSDDVAEEMTVRVDGDRAVVDATAGEDAEYVRRGDGWVYVWREN